MHPTTTQHINPELNQSPVGTQGLCVRCCAMVGTQHVALRTTSANTNPDAHVETLRATSPTHHAPTRKNIEGKHALTPCPAGLDPASHPRWMHRIAWDCGATPARTQKATSLQRERKRIK